MSGLHRLRVTELHPNLLCILCGGYYVDATTIVECLHSFCKTCIVRYLESSKFCPICDVQVHKTKPLLSIRPDKILQDIVYKLVPGLYQNEMCRRRDFYAGHPEVEPPTAEDGGRDLGRWYILPDDPVSVALHPAPSSCPFQSTPASFSAFDDTKMFSGDNKVLHLDLKDKSHIRYLQCPAGVSIAQLKRLLRAKFGVGPAHPLAVLTCTSSDPLSDSLTLVDVAYITSWQKTEPLQLQYRIYEKANKKIKLDPETFNCEGCNSNEEMPKLEPNVGGDAQITAFASFDQAGNVLEYKCAPLLQAYETSDCDSSYLRDEENRLFENGSRTEKQPPDCKECNADLRSVVKSEETVPVGDCKDPPSDDKVDQIQCELIQGSHSDSSGCAVKANVGVESCDNNVQNTGSVSTSNSIVDSYLTYNSAYAAPSNGVNVGVTFISSEVGYLGPAGVPCAFIPSGGCVPVSSDCIPSGVGVPTLPRPMAGEGGATDHVNVWVASGIPNLVGEQALVKVDGKSSVGDAAKGAAEEEGKEVQLTISESGIMSASGHGTTVEGMVNPIESEACELLSKIESGSLGEYFPQKGNEKSSKKAKSELPNSVNKKTKIKDVKPIENTKNKVESKATASKTAVTLKGGTAGVPMVPNNKSNNGGSKDSKDLPNEKVNANSIPDAAAAKKHGDTSDKNIEKITSESIKVVEVQQLVEPKDCNTTKDSRLTHIPASLTAASMANMNKPLLKAGMSKVSPGEEPKTREPKANNGSVSFRKDGKQESGGKSSSSSSGSCRKSSQPYGYKTLKTPPKSWNPTISREQLAFGAGKSSNGKGAQEQARPNKFFKARNNPRFLGNPSAGVRPLYTGVNDSTNLQKRGVLLKFDPKTLETSLSAPINSDIRASGCLTSLTSSASLVSSDHLVPVPPFVTQTALRIAGSSVISDSRVTSVSVSVAQDASAETSVADSKARLDDTGVTSLKVATTLPASLKSVAKESTNCSSKNIGKHNSNIQGNKVIHDVTKTASSCSVGSKINNKNSAAVKKDNVTSVQTTVGNSKLDVSVPAAVTETRINYSSAVQVPSTAGNTVVSSSKAPLSTAVPTCVTQLRPTTTGTLNVQNAGFQPQQHFTMGSPTVGIIPSSGVSLPASIGTMPLPYYSSPSLGYPTYPYVYHTPDSAIGLIPQHPTASFIPTFPSCLSPRSPLSPRNVSGTKMLPDLPLQPNLLPLVPLVSQVTPQALSPRPMTPPSPRTPTSNQSPKPYTAQSPRQSSTNHSRPLTPHSPKMLNTGQARSPAQSPKLPMGQQGKPLGSQPGLPTTDFLFQTLGTQVTGSSHPTSLASKLNACVQTSLSHTLIMPKSNLSFISSKPSVPHSTKSTVVSQSLALSQQMASVSSCYSVAPNSSKPSRPKMPQSPKATSAAAVCLASSETALRMGVMTQTVMSNQSPQFSKCSIPHNPYADTRTTSVSAPRMTTSSQEQLQVTIPQSPVLSLPLPVSQFATVIPSSGLSMSHMTSLEGTVLHPQTLQVSLPHGMGSISQSGENAEAVALSRGSVHAELPSAISSSSLPTLCVPSLPQSALQNVTPIVTSGSLLSNQVTTSIPVCISAVPTCAMITSQQNLPIISNESSISSVRSSVSTELNPSSNTADSPKVASTTVAGSKGSVSIPVSGNHCSNTDISVGCTVTTSHSSITKISSNMEARCTGSVDSGCSVSNMLSITPCSMPFPYSTPAVTVPVCVGANSTSCAATVTFPVGTQSLTTTRTTSIANVSPQSSATADVNTSSVANTYSLSTSTSVAISPSITKNSVVPFNGTTEPAMSQSKMPDPPVCAAQSQSSGVLSPSVSSSDMVGKSVVSAKERSGSSVPQPSACTPVCDVTDVIDAKLQCAEQSVSSSEGPRPCLKS